MNISRSHVVPVRKRLGELKEAVEGIAYRYSHKNVKLWQCDLVQSDSVCNHTRD